MRTKTKITLYGEVTGNIWMPGSNAPRNFTSSSSRSSYKQNLHLSGHHASLDGDHVPARCIASPH